MEGYYATNKNEIVSVENIKTMTKMYKLTFTVIAETIRTISLRKDDSFSFFHYRTFHTLFIAPVSVIERN